MQQNKGQTDHNLNRGKKVPCMYLGRKTQTLSHQFQIINTGITLRTPPD